MMGHSLFVIYESGGTLTYLKCIIFQSLNLGVNVSLFYSSLILNHGAVGASGNCIRRGNSIRSLRIYNPRREGCPAIPPGTG
jgi:hypothetical protein